MPTSSTASSGGDAAVASKGKSAGPQAVPTEQQLLKELMENEDASDQYQRLTPLEHVLKRPDTYIGSVEFHQSTMWVCDEDGQMQYKEVSIVPGMFKIFDEILVNAADNKVRDPAMKSIKVAVNPDANEISVVNDGKGIPIQIHKKEQVYIPELIFGNLLTGSNYNDDEDKVTGGRNGFGAKLCNIFSTKFILETADKTQVYRQVWTDNMTKKQEPTITKNKSGKSYTSVTFYPDLPKFGMDRLDSDLVSVLRRRVWDLAGTTRGVNVSWNTSLIPVKDFKAYVDLFVKSLSKNTEGVVLEDGGKPSTIVYAKPNDRWEVAFALSDGTFNQLSFVNSIATTSGGTHVNYISDQIVDFAIESLNKATKNSKSRGGKLQKVQVRANMFVFVNSKINNPSFTSQTKEQLTSKVSAFGSKCELPDRFLKDVISKTGLNDKLIELSEKSMDKQMAKQDGGKKRRLTGFAKLDDANKAGTRESHKCTLILTEGDSAQGAARDGINHVGRDYYGCFPLRGKMLNVRDASNEQILKNAEIQALKQIVGLQHKKHYSSVDGLRYGHIMIMTDQDHDGSHIKGLIINFLETSFPGLLDIPGFLREFITPIVKVSVMEGSRVKDVISFFSMPQYEQWRDTVGKTVKWTQKYYKGLGTSERSDFVEYFSNIGVHEKIFLNLQPGDKDCMELAFSKHKADDRKQWLQDLKAGTYLDPEIRTIPISDFVNKELILFSMADNVRSIPSVMDGLKPGQRKVIWSSFARKLYKEIRVAQLAGYVSEKAAYHHGEQALHQTIIGLAQDFVGSNNINLLLPKGQFGSRASGGKDAAAARYIYTLLHPLTKVILNPLDEPVLSYMVDDGAQVEPEYYVPVLPMVLVNGSEGIGTGWSSTIPNYNPTEIVENIRRLMRNEPMRPMNPWFKGWTGQIDKVPTEEFQYRVVGRIEEIDDTTLAITELPARMWTQTMKEFLLKSLIGSSRDQKDAKDKKPALEFIQDFTEDHGTGVRFIVKLSTAEMAKAKAVGLYTKFKLIAPLNTSNMVAFDPQGRLRKYKTAEDIIKEFYYVRLDTYQKRKNHMVDELRNRVEKITAQARFIKLIVEKELIVSNRRKAELVAELKSLRFPRFGVSDVPIWEDSADENELIEDDEEDVQGLEDEDIVSATENAMSAKIVADVHKKSSGNYDYLLNMSILSLTKERYEKLLRERQGTEDELNDLLTKSPKDLWSHDLDTFEMGWDALLSKFLADLADPGSAGKAAKPAKRRKKDDDDDYSETTKKRKTKTAALKNLPKSGTLIAPPSVEEFALRKVKKEPSTRAATPSVKLEHDADTESVATRASTEAPDASTSASTMDSGAGSDPKLESEEVAPKAAKAVKKASTKLPAKPSSKVPESRLKKKTTEVESDDDFDVGSTDVAAKREVRPRKASPVSVIDSDDSSDGGEGDNSLFVMSDDDEDLE